ncbi:asparaginase [Caenimonas sedimenti]|uniref:Asparaginase n=1 Tax=Caenimonas sedimenti TaxID=2596921 RepID=A0A562ZN57_9BURK|nr:asparaginase [Caenimonas sedimenti]TWO69953.1 asparaginase [Caenimonas sedimenti]
MQVSVEKIVVLATGGTVAGKADWAEDTVGYQAAQLAVADLLTGVRAPGGLALAAEQVAQVDSKNMEFAIWARLAARCQFQLAQPDVRGIVITHGTDTMEETAFFLQRALAPAKPVVLTGAMRPVTAVVADGPQNIADALAVAASPGASGVCVAFAGLVHAARDVMKVHSYRLDAFSSGEAGPLAVVEDGRVRSLRPWPRDPVRGPAALAASWPRVEIVMNYAGAGGAVVDALVAQGVAGIVAAGTGNGTLHRDLEAALLRAQARGVAVRRASRCAYGRVIAHPTDTIPPTELPPVKARIELLLELMA